MGSAHSHRLDHDDLERDAGAKAGAAFPRPALAAIASLTLIGLARIYRPLVMETVDPGFLASVGRAGGPTQILFRRWSRSISSADSTRSARCSPSA